MTRGAALLLLLASLSASARAQSGGAQGEVRAEWFATRAILGGAGIAVPVGTYARIGAVVAAGTFVDAPHRTALRADALLRFHLDPFRQFRRAPYGAAGITAQRGRTGTWRPYLLLRAGVEGSPHAGWIPALEAGLGGGAHVSLALRRARHRGR